MTFSVQYVNVEYTIQQTENFVHEKANLKYRDIAPLISLDPLSKCVIFSLGFLPTETVFKRFYLREGASGKGLGGSVEPPKLRINETLQHADLTSECRKSHFREPQKFSGGGCSRTTHPTGVTRIPFSKIMNPPQVLRVWY